MTFIQFLIGGLIYAAGSYSSGLMAGFHPIKEPKLTNNDLKELEKNGYSPMFYAIGSIICPIIYAIIFFSAIQELNLFVVLGTAFILHPICTQITRRFLSDNEIASWVILFTICFIPIMLILKFF